MGYSEDLMIKNSNLFYYFFRSRQSVVLMEFAWEIFEYEKLLRDASIIALFRQYAGRIENPFLYWSILTYLREIKRF